MQKVDIISAIQKMFYFCWWLLWPANLLSTVHRVEFYKITYIRTRKVKLFHMKKKYFLSWRNDRSHLLSVMSCFDQSTLLINISPPRRGQQVCYVSAKMFVTLKPTKTLGTADTHFSPLKPHPHFPTDILRHENMTNLEFSPATFTRSGRPYL